jgi:glycosyltransferase involved in cell wall biosynthesis
MKKFRVHLLGLAHLPTIKEISACAYTQKVYKMAKMLKSLGHTVFFYGAEGSDVECDKSIIVVSKDILRETYGDYDWKVEMFKHDPKDLAHQTFNHNAAVEILKRREKTDFVFVSMGTYQKPITDRLDIPLCVESGIGYYGIYAPYKVFESYCWMHHVYGKQGLENGNFYDCVIPNYFDPKDFTFKQKKDDYFLYLGRVIHRKGICVAKEVCDKLGKRLIIAGQLGKEPVDISGPNIEFVGYADNKKRVELLSNAKAIFMPTIYFEPFGGVSIEAMLCGTPVISTDWGVFAENNIHGKTGYRCRTQEQFIWAAKNIDNIDPNYCHKYAIRNFSMDRIKLMYQEYMEQLNGLHRKGWYEENPERMELDWLKKYYE